MMIDNIYVCTIYKTEYIELTDYSRKMNKDITMKFVVLWMILN